VSVHLLDVNVLVALFDPDHVQHDLAHEWFGDERANGWATCPTTENAFLRVMTHPACDGTITRPEAIAARLSVTDLERIRPSYIRGQRQVIDVYLLALAVRVGGRLATFDTSITLGAVVGATKETVRVISAATGI
jgi:uncharacterized protein